ncbi:hypothetical protein C4571_02495 [Candidatus Parcubacteria bacterium]|nr:MAG: hypothetical protein C4571_02495 [Candidatus Parcubacteria bacterium]
MRNSTPHPIFTEDRTGQFLVEALVALGILVVGLLGILTLLTRSFALGRIVSDNNTATYLAAEGIEIVKNLIDANVIQGQSWLGGFTDGDFEVEYDVQVPAGVGQGGALVPYQDRFLTFDSATNLYGYTGFDTTKFKRLVRIELIPSGVVVDEVKVNSIISWTSGGGSFSVDLEDRFLNWRPTP